MHLALTSVIGFSAAGVLGMGTMAATVHNAIPKSYEHDVNVGGNVNITVDVTVHTPDLDKLKPGSLIPSRINITLPDGFTLNLPDSKQMVDVHAPTDYTLHQP